MVRSEMRSDHRRVVCRQRDRVSVRSLPSQGTFLVRRTDEPVSKVLHELLSFWKSSHGDIERWLVVEEARLASSLGIPRRAEDVWVVDPHSTAGFEDGVEPVEEVVDPYGGRIGEERDLGSFSFGFEGVGDREVLTRREPPAESLLA